MSSDAGRRLALPLLLVLSLGGAAPLAAQQREELESRAFRLRHQSPARALLLVGPELSFRGSVEVDLGRGAVVVRDTPRVLARVARLIAAFDHPPQPLLVEVRLFEAGPATGSERAPLPPELERRLRHLFRYESFHQIAYFHLPTREGETLRLAAESAHALRIDLGPLMPQGYLEVERLALWRGAADAPPMIDGGLRLWVGHPLVLGLAASEQSPRALFVAVTLVEAGDASAKAGGGGGGR